jgi:hypothetical protein
MIFIFIFIHTELIVTVLYWYLNSRHRLAQDTHVDISGRNSIDSEMATPALPIVTTNEIPVKNDPQVTKRMFHENHSSLDRGQGVKKKQNTLFSPKTSRAKSVNPSQPNHLNRRKMTTDITESFTEIARLPLHQGINVTFNAPLFLSQKGQGQIPDGLKQVTLTHPYDSACSLTIHSTEESLEVSIIQYSKNDSKKYTLMFYRFSFNENKTKVFRGIDSFKGVHTRLLVEITLWYLESNKRSSEYAEHHNKEATFASLKNILSSQPPVESEQFRVIWEPHVVTTALCNHIQSFDGDWVKRMVEVGQLDLSKELLRFQHPEDPDLLLEIKSERTFLSVDLKLTLHDESDEVFPLPEWKDEVPILHHFFKPFPQLPSLDKVLRTEGVQLFAEPHTSLLNELHRVYLSQWMKEYGGTALLFSEEIKGRQKINEYEEWLNETSKVASVGKNNDPSIHSERSGTKNKEDVAANEITAFASKYRRNIFGTPDKLPEDLGELLDFILTQSYGATISAHVLKIKMKRAMILKFKDQFDTPLAHRFEVTESDLKQLAQVLLRNEGVLEDGMLLAAREGLSSALTSYTNLVDGVRDVKEREVRRLAEIMKQRNM